MNDAASTAELIRLLTERGLSLVTAESCTGGLIGKRLTDVPGASGAYLGGWVTYSNRMKCEQLGVPQEVLDQQGAVSEPVVRAMAAGAIERSGADVAVAVSGVAGPGGGTADRPIGTVWVGVAWRGGAGLPIVQAVRCEFAGDRGEVRGRAAGASIEAVRLILLDQPISTLADGAAPSGR